MRPLDRLGADDLRAVVAAFGDALRSHRERLNRLNVYPVPDGDTGTNMALTVESVLAELEGAGSDMASVCRAIAHGSLMGARGNSGVILSQILRGMTACFSDGSPGDGSPAGAVDAPCLARGLTAAAEGAYRAVGRPVEGTILTVAREAAEAAEEAAGRSPEAPLADVLQAALAGAEAALERTPEMLDVLRRAGVVDAGGAGFVLFFHATLSVVTGQPVPDPEPTPEPAGVDRSMADKAPGGDGDGVGGGLRYEVMYLLEAPDEEMAAFREAWSSIGDSIVVVGGDGTWNCHIHCDDIGAAIEAGIAAGRPRRIRVTDLAEQVEEERWVREGVAAGDVPGAPADEEAGTDVPATDVVAVANGEGLRNLFRSLGAGAVVAGGQSMNPSTAQLVEAVRASPSEEVVILPNNANIVAVAEQVDGLTAKAVRVVPTRGIAEGLAALLAYDPTADAGHNAKAMSAAANDVIAGEVTMAVRSSVCDAGPINKGDWLGIGPERIHVVRSSAADAATALLDALVDPEHELAILIVGSDADEADTARITGWLAEHRPGLEVEVHHGGQPLYPYLLGIE